ncbi:MAG: ATP-binding protein [Verrucomicrobia bacterium]|nr:ATP-binding protein [Verrucomicrobiota bacterium]
MNRPTEWVTVPIRPHKEELPRLHTVLDELGRKHGIPAQAVSDLQLVLEEHLTNILCHGKLPNGEGHIGVRWRLSGHALEIEVEDNGSPFNPLEHPQFEPNQPFDERNLGGLGIHMMRSLTDGLDYRREAGLNIVTLRKQIPGAT